MKHRHKHKHKHKVPDLLPKAPEVAEPLGY